MPNWTLLEDFLSMLNKYDDLSIHPSEFMWMGSEKSDEGPTINLYKNKLSRTYVNIDEDDAHWIYTGSGYKRYRLNSDKLDKYLEEWGWANEVL